MPRFFDPERYNEDWYIELKGEYQKFFDFIIEMCDNAGVWKPNKFDFEAKTGFKLNLDSFLKKVNGNKERIIVLENGRWFIPGFIQYQFFNKKSSFEFTSHPLHKNIINSLEANNIQPTLVKGLVRAWQALKDKDKDLKKGGMEENIDKNPTPGISPAPPVLLPPNAETVLYSIEHCMEIALKDQRWVRANKTSEQELKIFNASLEKEGTYEKNPRDYKTHFARWKNKKGGVVEEVKETQTGSTFIQQILKHVKEQP